MQEIARTGRSTTPLRLRTKVRARVAAGWHIQGADGLPQFGPVNREQWDWPQFIQLLADPGRRVALEGVFAKHELRTGDYFGGGFIRRVP